MTKIVLVAALGTTLAMAFGLLPPTNSFAQSGVSSSKSNTAKIHKNKSADRFRSPNAHSPSLNRNARDARRPASNNCAEYGAGFVRMEGSNTCVRIGGSIAIGTSGNSGSQFRPTR